MDPKKNINKALVLIALITGVLAIIIPLLVVYVLHASLPPAEAPATGATPTSVATAFPTPTVFPASSPTSPPPPTPTAVPTAAATPTTVPGTPPPAIGTLPPPPPTLVVNLPLSSLDIITDTPSSMQVKASYTIKVSLTPKGQARISDLMIEMATPTASNTIPVGTPGASLKEAFGPRLEPVAMATLQADTFVISPVGPVEEPLDQPEVVWIWSITPTEPGTQYLSVDIEGYWKAANGEARGPYRIGDKTFSVDVSAPTPVPTPTPTPEPFITPGHIDIGAIITSLPGILLGAGGLGALLIVGLVSHLKRRDRKKRPPVPHSSRGRSSRKKPTH